MENREGMGRARRVEFDDGSVAFEIWPADTNEYLVFGENRDGHKTIIASLVVPYCEWYVRIQDQSMEVGIIPRQPQTVEPNESYL